MQTLINKTTLSGTSALLINNLSPNTSPLPFSSSQLTGNTGIAGNSSYVGNVTFTWPDGTKSYRPFNPSTDKLQGGCFSTSTGGTPVSTFNPTAEGSKMSNMVNNNGVSTVESKNTNVDSSFTFKPNYIFYLILFYILYKLANGRLN